MATKKSPDTSATSSAANSAEHNDGLPVEGTAGPGAGADASVPAPQIPEPNTPTDASQPPSGAASPESDPPPAPVVGPASAAKGPTLVVDVDQVASRLYLQAADALARLAGVSLIDVGYFDSLPDGVAIIGMLDGREISIPPLTKLPEAAPENSAWQETSALWEFSAGLQRAGIHPSDILSRSDKPDGTTVVVTRSGQKITLPKS
jgi:hypothetical protein